MDEHNQPSPGKDDVRCSRQILAVEAVSQAAGMHGSPDNQFRASVTASDPSHILAAASWIYPVH